VYLLLRQFLRRATILKIQNWLRKRINFEVWGWQSGMQWLAKEQEWQQTISLKLGRLTSPHLFPVDTI